MKSVCKSLMLSLVLGITALLPTGLLAQSQPEPSIVVSIANLDEQLNDVGYLLTASGFPEMKFAVSAAKVYTKGIDTKKNAGVMLFFNEESQTPDFLGFVPITDIDEMLDVIAGLGPEVDEEDDMYVVVAPDGTEIMIKEQGGYAFISTSEAMLEELPSDPASVIGDLPSKFNLAVKMMPQQVPQALKDSVMDMIKEGSAQTLENLDDDVQSDLQRKNMEMQMQQFESLLKETEEVTIGMAIDPASKTLYTDFIFKALPESSLAKKIANSKADAPSRFSGFMMDDAAMTFNSNNRMGKDESKNYIEMLDGGKKAIFNQMEEEGDLSDEETEAVQSAIADVFEVLKKTLAEGVFDGGAVVMLDGKEMNFAGGVQVADPMLVQKAVKNLVPMIEEKAGDKLQVKLDVRQYKGINFHEIIIPVPSEEEEMQDIFGDELKLVLGMGNKTLYVAGGTSPNKLLKRGMDETHPAIEMQQMNFFVTPILKMAARLDTPPQIGLMAEKMAEVGKDRISIVTNLIENGTKTRFEVQDGILSLIRVGFESMQGGGFPDDDF